ncbi:hypothetical protein J25TS5_20380 [Paenibacillus faecis]|uniref:VanZ family protein n=1 Tax=Paenibacillus faecis TaxID=862114 RepID=UPI001AFF5887|nr:VanZ family protein [Paenibacillus faecis]GIO85106.1 hypothetical protein J25TS5_20380 [Paenibacillus faecis]
MRRVVFLVITGYTLLIGYWMLFGFGREPQPGYLFNLKPLCTIRQFLQVDHFSPKVWMINLVGNVGVFVPFGVLLPLFLKEGRLLLKSLCLFLSGVFVLESLQLLTKRGSWDIDDFILNTLGFLLGYGLYLIPKRSGR